MKENNIAKLVQKYNVPGPRYTSYPTVPYWNPETFSVKGWEAIVEETFNASNATEGISLYVHLPFCERLCTFCGCHKRITKRHSVEEPYIASVLREWALYLKLFKTRPKIKELHLGGGTPTFFSPENLERLISGLLAHSDPVDRPSFSFEGHPNNTTQEHLGTLKALGFDRVSFGVQDYSPTVQKAINRIQPYARVEQVTQWARALGYTSVSHDLIYGLPFQTLEDVEDTIQKTAHLRPDRIAFYSYAHVPWHKGTGQRGFKDADLPDGSLKRKQYARGKELLQQVGYHEVGMDHFSLESDALYKAMKGGGLHRNFMGYTPERTSLLVGLGASSISDAWGGFAQNEKQIERYQEQVASGILPVFRGHILSSEDQIIRQHILNLMCGLRTEWSKTEDYFPELPQVMDRLRMMEADGLLKIGDTYIQVYEKGRPFVRNIAMAFDLMLHRKAPETQLFSMTV